MALQVIEQASATDIGERESNEDASVVAPPFFAVADGMGGENAGEVASRTAAEAFARRRRSNDPPERQLAEIAQRANRRIYELASQDKSRRGMGTTLTAATVSGHSISIGHVGDSRAYRLRDGELEQLTNDHSLAAELVRAGELPPEAAGRRAPRSIITRALGLEPEVEMDGFTVRARGGDVYLLCSDGLTAVVADAELAAILGKSETLEEAATRLVQAANERGGKDNVTVVLFRLGETCP